MASAPVMRIRSLNHPSNSGVCSSIVYSRVSVHDWYCTRFTYETLTRNISPARHEPHYYAVFDSPVGFYAEIGVVAAFRMLYAALPVYGIGNAEFVIADHVILPVRSPDVFFCGTAFGIDYTTSDVFPQGYRRKSRRKLSRTVVGKRRT